MACLQGLSAATARCTNINCHWPLRSGSNVSDQALQVIVPAEPTGHSTTVLFPWFDFPICSCTYALTQDNRIEHQNQFSDGIPVTLPVYMGINTIASCVMSHTFNFVAITLDIVVT